MADRDDLKNLSLLGKPDTRLPSCPEEAQLEVFPNQRPGRRYWITLNCPEFSYGLSVKIDPYGVWVISELLSQENDGIFNKSGNLHKTESTMTVLRAVASWIVDLEESSRNT
jgi:hypothetical protein